MVRAIVACALADLHAPLRRIPSAHHASSSSFASPARSLLSCSWMASIGRNNSTGAAVTRSSSAMVAGDSSQGNAARKRLRGAVPGPQTATTMEDLERDPDIAAEAAALQIAASEPHEPPAVAAAAPQVVKLIVQGNTYQVCWPSSRQSVTATLGSSSVPAQLTTFARALLEIRGHSGVAATSWRLASSPAHDGGILPENVRGPPP